MKLKEFSMATAASKRGGKHSNSLMIVHNKGRIAFTPLMCEKMNLKLGDRIALFQNEDSGTWYVEKNENGFELRKFNSQSDSLIVQNKITTDTMFAGFRIKETSMRFKVLPEPVKFGKRILHELIQVPSV